MNDCTCPNIVVGFKFIESKNWNPHCTEHGYASDWYNSEEEVQKREERSQRTRQLFAQVASDDGETVVTILGCQVRAVTSHSTSMEIRNTDVLKL